MGLDLWDPFDQCGRVIECRSKAWCSHGFKPHRQQHVVIGAVGLSWGHVCLPRLKFTGQGPGGLMQATGSWGRLRVWGGEKSGSPVLLLWAWALEIPFANTVFGWTVDPEHYITVAASWQPPLHWTSKSVCGRELDCFSDKRSHCFRGVRKQSIQEAHMARDSLT